MVHSNKDSKNSPSDIVEDNPIKDSVICDMLKYQAETYLKNGIRLLSLYRVKTLL